MKLLNRTAKAKTDKSYKKVVTNSALKKATKKSIQDQRRLSKKAAKLRTQTASR